MPKHCLEIGELKQQKDAEHVDAGVARLFGKLLVISGEVQEKLSQIKSCPKACNDGMVEIGVSSGQMRKRACPVMTSKCPYGQRMEYALDRYVSGLMSNICVPRRLLENLMAAHQTSVLAETNKWQMQSFLLFTGGTGSGKSFGAACVIHKYLKSLVINRFEQQTWKKAEYGAGEVIWCSATDMVYDKETAAQAKSKHLAVIDDLGGEIESPIAQSVLCGVILKRHDMKLPTVITTALTMLEIDIRYGGRVADRLTEDIGNGGMIIECGEVSMRSPMEFPIQGEI